MTDRPRPLRRIVFAWLLYSVAVVGLSLTTGYRASRAARAPQYLLTKTRVVVETTPVPVDEQEAEIQRRFSEAGEETTVPEVQPMFVLGLLDAALPLVVAGGLIAIAAALFVRRRERFGRATPEDLS